MMHRREEWRTLGLGFGLLILGLMLAAGLSLVLTYAAGNAAGTAAVMMVG